MTPKSPPFFKDPKLPHYILSAVMDFILAIAMISLPLLAKNGFHVSQGTVGAISGTGAVVYSVFSPILGRLSERLGRRMLCLAGAMGYFVTYFLVYLTTDYWQLYPLAAVSGLSMAAFWPAMEASIADRAPSGVLRVRVGRFNLSWTFGLAIGTYVAGMLYDIQMRLPLLVVSISSAGVALFIWKGIREHDIPPDDKNEDVENDAPPEYVIRTFLLISWLANFGSYTCVSIMRSLFPPDVTTRPSLMFSGTTTGTLSSLITLAMMTTFWVLMRTARWHHRFWVLLLGEGLIIVGIVVTSVATALPVFVAAVISIGIGAGIAYYSSIFYSLEGYSNRGQKSGIHEAVLGWGIFLGPIVGGFVADATGRVQNQYLFGAAFLLLIVVIETLLFRRLMRRGRQAERPANTVPD